MNQPIPIQTGTGNVFADLDLDNPEELLVKAELARQISNIITQQMTQSEAAEILGIDPAQILALIKGQLAIFSTARLFNFLNALGLDVEIVVKSKPELRSKAKTWVVYP